MQEQLPINVKGHVTIKDDLGNTLLDKSNAIHPQNMSRVIARALSNEDNFFIHRIAFGNGGTNVDAALNISYRTPNDGISPDTAGWESRLYNETYSEIVDDSNISIGTGPGATPGSDPTSIEHVSGPGVRSTELGLTSRVEISVTLNPDEPTGQFVDDSLGPLEDPDADFTFDEIGLFTSGLPPQQTSGYQNINVESKDSTSDTGLATSTTYEFDITVDGGTPQTISITTPASGSGSLGEILYSDLVNLINNSSIIGASASITDNISIQTFGFLRFTSLTSGAASTIDINDPGAPYPSNFLFSNLTDFQGIELPVDGSNAGIQNNPVNAIEERERLLTHIIFSPIQKSQNRSFFITYTLTISVERSSF